MKKILVVMDDVNYKGGAHFATFQIINYLCSMQLEVHLYSPEKCTKETKCIINRKVIFENKKKYKGFNYIIVPFENSIFREEISLLKNVTKIQWIHIEYDKWKDKIEIDIDYQRKVFSRFDKLVFVSENNRKSFLTIFPEFFSKSYVIYNFLDEKKIHAGMQMQIDVEIMQKKNKNELNFVVSGRLEPQKAYHRMIDIVKILNERGILSNWYILGAGYEYESLKHRCKKYSIDNIHFLGYRENPYPYVRHADIFAILSEYEGLALVVAESLELGVPVLSTESGGVREILSEEYGWIVKNDIYSIIDQIEQIYLNRDIIEEKSSALNRYTYNNQRVERAIKSLLDEEQGGEEMQRACIESVKSSMPSIKVSIIVPVYNMEKYLEECLDSLVNQTLSDIEIVIVNDGSTDSSMQIIEDYIYKYPQKIRAFSIENRGLGEARNYGISKANGTYLGFVDSDDSVRLDMFEIMYSEALKNNADCILTDYIATWDTGKSEYVNSLPIKNPDRFDALKYSSKYGVVNICTKLVNRELFEHVKFPKGFYEDLATVPILLSYAKKIHYIQQGLYFYRQRSGSITSIKNNDKRLFDCYAAWDRILTMSNPLYATELAFSVYWSLNFFCTDFLDDFILFCKQYYDRNKEMFENNFYISNAVDKKSLLDFANLPQIPKIIHYCWFGEGEKSELIKHCIESWKKFAPDFKIIEWNESNCDIHENNYVEKAYTEEKWAFVSDYFRLKAIVDWGGVYLDTDMELMKPLELYLYSEAFFAFETPVFVHAGIIGAKKGNTFIKGILDTYQTETFGLKENNMPLPIPRRITSLLEKSTNIELNGKTQMLNNGIKLYSANIMTMDFHDGRCAANHHYEGNWLFQEKNGSYNYGYEVMKHYFTWDLLKEQRTYNEDYFTEYSGGYNYKILYEQITSSTSWKITEPLRKILDVIKRLFKREG